MDARDLLDPRAFRGLHCPVCDCAFRGLPGHPSLPLTLECGHSLCAGCVTARDGDAQCPVCLAPAGFGKPLNGLTRFVETCWEAEQVAGPPGTLPFIASLSSLLTAPPPPYAAHCTQHPSVSSSAFCVKDHKIVCRGCTSSGCMAEHPDKVKGWEDASVADTLYIQTKPSLSLLAAMVTDLEHISEDIVSAKTDVQCHTAQATKAFNAAMDAAEYSLKQFRGAWLKRLSAYRNDRTAELDTQLESARVAADQLRSACVLGDATLQYAHMSRIATVLDVLRNANTVLKGAPMQSAFSSVLGGLEVQCDGVTRLVGQLNAEVAAMAAQQQPQQQPPHSEEQQQQEGGEQASSAHATGSSVGGGDGDDVIVKSSTPTTTAVSGDGKAQSPATTTATTTAAGNTTSSTVNHSVCVAAPSAASSRLVEHRFKPSQCILSGEGLEHFRMGISNSSSSGSSDSGEVCAKAQHDKCVGNVVRVHVYDDNVGNCNSNCSTTNDKDGDDVDDEECVRVPATWLRPEQVCVSGGGGGSVSVCVPRLVAPGVVQVCYCVPDDGPTEVELSVSVCGRALTQNPLTVNMYCPPLSTPQQLPSAISASATSANAADATQASFGGGTSRHAKKKASKARKKQQQQEEKQKQQAAFVPTPYQKQCMLEDEAIVFFDRLKVMGNVNIPEGVMAKACEYMCQLGGCEEVQEAACYALANVTTLSSHNRVTLLKVNGVDALFASMDAFPKRERVQSNALWTFCNIMHSPSLTPRVMSRGFLARLYAVMDRLPDSDPVQYNGCWAVANIGKSGKAYARELSESGAVARLNRAAKTHGGDVAQNAREALMVLKTMA